MMNASDLKAIHQKLDDMLRQEAKAIIQSHIKARMKAMLQGAGLVK